MRLSVLILLFFCQGANILHGQNNATIRSEYYAGLPFWESPIQPFKGEYPITREEALKRIHLRFDYDAENRIKEVSVRIGSDYKVFEGFFGNLYINAPRTVISYSDGREVHHFYDRFENRIEVMGQVFEKIYEKDKYGRNIKLYFLNKAGEPTVDLFGNQTYEWIHHLDGSVLELRWDKDQNITPLRGSFEFMRTRIYYGSDGQVSSLHNVDESGQLVNAPCGAALLRYFYDNHGRFSRWEVYDKDGDPARGPSGTSGEQNIFDKFYLKDIVFFDEVGNPATHWSGAERWHFEYDGYGNMTSLHYRNANDQPKNALNGYASVHYTWSKDGRHLLTQYYQNAEGLAVSHPVSGISQIEYVRGRDGLVSEVHHKDSSGRPVARKDTGVAIVRYAYDKSYRRMLTIHLDVNGNEINRSAD